MDSSEKVKHISKWILNYVNSMPVKAKSLVIGISGGIDSSVSSTLCALTGMKTIVLSMPIKQKSIQHDLSLKHQEWLKKNFQNVQGHTIELDSLFTSFKLIHTFMHADLIPENANSEDTPKSLIELGFTLEIINLLHYTYLE